MVATAPPRSFVPQQLDPSDFMHLQALYEELRDRAINSPSELEKWLADFSELTSVVDEYGSRRYIDKSCHTDDAAIEQRFMRFVEHVEPKIKPLYFALQKKFLDSPHQAALTDKRYEMLKRKWRADVEVFRPENVDIETQITRHVNEYDKIFGKMMVNFQGKEYTLQQLARFQEDNDRQTRQETWEIMTHRRMEDRAEIEKIFETLLPLRQKLATNAGFDNYVAYQFKALKRFDYTPEDSLRFAGAIEHAVMPVIKRLNQKRASDMHLDALRPWDMDVDPFGREPLRPFDPSGTDDLINKTKEIFDRLSPELSREFETLRFNNNLDLQSRKGKQPGGYQCSLEESRQPFIFMNAAGLQRDVETLLHEGGHAFHFIAAAQREPLAFLRSAPMEFCEVASMGMELLGIEHLDVFYTPQEADRAKRKHIEGIIRFLPWMATIDSFQHWLYSHPGHSESERTAYWLSLLERFSVGVDWSGWEEARACSWQRQLHLFHVPFYYIEYGIAQLGAVQLWLKSKEDPRRALSNYRAALALGGTRPLPDLFAAAGIRFDFSAATLGPLMTAMQEELGI